MPESIQHLFSDPEKVTGQKRFDKSLECDSFSLSSFEVMLITVALEGMIIKQTGIQIFHDRIAADRLSAIMSCLEDTFPKTCIEIIAELSRT